MSTPESSTRIQRQLTGIFHVSQLLLVSNLLDRKDDQDSTPLFGKVGVWGTSKIWHFSCLPSAWNSPEIISVIWANHDLAPPQKDPKGLEKHSLLGWFVDFVPFCFQCAMFFSLFFGINLSTESSACYHRRDVAKFPSPPPLLGQWGFALPLGAAWVIWSWHVWCRRQDGWQFEGQKNWTKTHG